MTARRQTGLAQLPQEHIDDILRTVQASCGLKGLASCRLVSKSWLAAVQLYPVDARDTQEVYKLRKIFPNLASMAITCKPGAHLSLGPFRNYSQLTSISLSARAASGRPELTLVNLPSTLRAAELQNFFLPPNTFANVTTSLTQLHYQLDGHASRQLKSVHKQFPRQWEWMQDLQHLQELKLTGIKSECYKKIFGYIDGRTSGSQSLALTDPTFVGDKGKNVEHAANFTKLRSLRISKTGFREEWFQLAFQFLPNYTSLSFQKCQYIGKEAYIKAETGVFNLMSLTMRQSDIVILDFVGVGLQSLEIEPRYTSSRSYTNLMDPWKADFGKAFRKIGGLTNLTRLELDKFKPHPHHMRHLQGLHLRELALHRCSGVELDLFVPGALLMLTSLHIRESQGKQLAAQGQDETRQKLVECGKIVLDLPHLVEVSGSSALFSIGMADGLSSWQKGNYTKGLKTVYERNLFAETYGLKVWRRP